MYRIKGAQLIPRIAFLIALALYVSGCDRKAETFEDCILENLKSGMSNYAVELVHLACKKKFPEGAEEFGF